MRIREQNTMRSKQNALTYTQETALGRWSNMLYYNGALLGRRKVFIDTVTPKWFRNTRKGTKKTFSYNPMTSLTLESDSSGTSANTHYIAKSPSGFDNPSLEQGDWLTAYLGGWEGKEIPSDSSVFTPEDIRDLVIEACTACRADIASGSAQLLVDLGESAQTVAMFTSPVNAMKSFFSKWQSVQHLPFKKQLGSLVQHAIPNVANAKSEVARVGYTSVAAADLYLVWRYGIKPLISTVEAVAKELDAKHGSVLKTARGSSRAYRDVVSVERIYDGKFYVDLEKRVTHDVTVRATSLNEYVTSWMDALGLSPRNIPSAVLDLTKFSFVLGWFVNCADVVQAAFPKLDVKHLCSGYTVIERVSTVYTIVDAQIAADYVRTHTWLGAPVSGTAWITKTLKRRVPGLVGPALVVKGDFKFNKPTRLGDAIALAIQQVNKAIRAGNH